MIKTITKISIVLRLLSVIIVSALYASLLITDVDAHQVCYTGCGSGSCCNDTNICSSDECLQLWDCSSCTWTPCRPKTVCWDGSKTCGNCPPQNQPIDGGWSGWSGCSNCSQIRQCNNPPPSNGGSYCSGPSTRACGQINGGWSAWSGCNSCIQTRSCTNPSPVCGGAGCSGSSTQACQVCGDGQRCGTESCDDGNSNNCDDCGNDCRLRVCGDGVLCTNRGEQCDLGSGNSNQPNQYCRTSCQLATCGDGIRDTGWRAVDGVPLREECDDGNTNNDDACDNNCRLTTTIVPWIATLDGGTYAKGGYRGFVIPRVSTLNPPISAGNGYPYNYNNPAMLSEYLASSGNSQLPGVNYISENDYRDTSYNDIGVNPSEFLTDTDSWFTYLYSKVSAKGPIPKITSSTISGNLSTAFSTSANSAVNRERRGNLRINANTVCDIKGVIFVRGNLVVDPDLRINNNQNGCIYIVSGNITILQGSRKNSPDLISIEPTDYDILEGFFISDGTFITEEDDFNNGRKADGVFLRGGVITQSISLQRFLEGFNDVVQPSEIFINDPRYMAIPEFISLFDQRRFSIREI